MFNDKVAQKPTIPVNAGKKKSANCAAVVNFEGCSKIGPNPWLALMAQNNNANAANGKKMALNTSSLRMLSTPRYTMNIFNNQNSIKQMKGMVCGNKEFVSISGNPGFHTLIIW